MSWEASGKVLKMRGIAPNHKLMLLIIADHYNDETEVAYPSQKRLADLTGYSIAQTKRILSELEGLGFLIVKERGGGRVSTHYGLDLDRIPPPGSKLIPPPGSNMNPEPIKEPTEPRSPQKASLSSGEAKPRNRKRDVIWDALVAAGWPSPLTRGERGRMNAAVRQLREAGATPQQVAARSAALRRKDWADMTVMALVMHWSALGQEEAKQGRRRDAEWVAPIPEPVSLEQRAANLARLNEMTKLVSP